MKIVITGGAGNLGGYVISELREQHEITILDLIAPQGNQCKFIKADLTNFEEVNQGVKNSDAIIHLGAIPYYDAGEAHKIWQTNVTGTFNVLEAAAQNNVMKMVIASSIDAYGFEFWSKPFTPDYFPLDENHPCKPDDTYGMSKMIDEKLCYGYSKRYQMQVICLRLTTILYPGSEDAARWVSNVEDPEFSFTLMSDRIPITDSIWAYVDARDVAQAFRLALKRMDKQDVHYEIYNIGAGDVLSKVDSLELIKRYYPDVKMILNKEGFLIKKNRALFDITKAQTDLKYKPKFTWRDHMSPSGL